MKKLLVITGVVLALCSFQGLKAQRGMGNPEEMKQKLKTDLKLTDIQADSVMSIQQEFMPQRRAIFQDQSLGQDDKKAKMKVIGDQADTRIKSALGDSLFNAYKDYRMKNRPQRN